MKEKINIINKTIDEKKNQLKERVAEDFRNLSNQISEISVIPSTTKKTEKEDYSKLISNILNSVTTISAGVVLISKLIRLAKQRELIEEDEAKDISETGEISKAIEKPKTSHILENVILLADLIYGGRTLITKLKVESSDAPSSPPSKTFDLNVLKSDVTSHGITIVKNVTDEWNQFMESNQKEIYALIEASSLNEKQKDKLASKIFTYEILNINLSELISIINSTSSLSEITQRLKDYSSMLISSIENAADKQITKYLSLEN